MARRMLVLLALMGVAGLIHRCDTAGPLRDTARHADPSRRLVILGFDGVDPHVLSALIAQGELPHIAGLARQGTFSPLDTSMPPQSPVAWAEFATGADNATHGLFDFVHLDRDRKILVSSMANIESRGWPWGDSVKNMRGGKPFWVTLDQAGIPATILACPADYPPTPFGGRALAGMGTPDLLGTIGHGTLFYEPTAGATDPAAVVASAAGYPTPPAPTASLPTSDLLHSQGCRLVKTPVVAGRFAGDLLGPRGSTTRFFGWRDSNAEAVALVLGDTTLVLQAGEWSHWYPVDFSNSARGMVRFLLRRAHPTLSLYVSPINLDPLRPDQPLSTPPGYSAELGRHLGRFYTETLPEDVAALELGALDRHEFRQLLFHVFRERERQLQFELSRLRHGLLFAYFSTADLAQHIFARGLDLDDVRNWPAREAYKALDAVVGRTAKALGDQPGEWWLLVVSDHGFAPFHTQVDINAWLEQTGWLVRKPPDQRRGPGLAQVDWTRTRAIGIGLNGVCILGSESERREQADVLRAELLRLMAPQADAAGAVPVFREVYTTRSLFPTASVEVLRHAPDVLLGYRRGYRTSWISAEGGVGPTLFAPNTRHWSSDHCMDWREVPGILLSSRPLDVSTTRPRLRMIASLVQAWFLRQ